MRPLILISNDDGVSAPGLHFLAEWVKEFGDVYVVAPDHAQSGMSSSMTFNSPLRITEHEGFESAKVFSVSGTPVDCVKLAMHRIVPRKPDILLSGINHGSNAGNSCIYSGTMGAVFEGSMIGIPSIGYSLLHHSLKADFSECERFIKQLTASVLANGLPADVCLNVNFPAQVKIEGIKAVRAARSHWTEEYKEYTDPHGTPFYWLSGSQINEEPDCDETDLYWLGRNFATVVPVMADQSAVAAIPEVSSLLLK